MSPQMRHGRPVPASHRKPNQGGAATSGKASSSGEASPSPAKAAPAGKPPVSGKAPVSGKPAVPAKAAAPAPGKPARGPRAPIDPDADLRDPSVVAVEEEAAAAPAPRTRTRTRSAGAAAEGRRHRKGSEPSRNPILRGLRGYFGAYLPLFAAFCILFVGVFIYSTVTHTPTAAESWTSISDKWKPQRDAARAKVFAAAEKQDVPGQMAAYKELASTTRGWSDELEKAKNHWTASTNATADNEQTASSMLQFITDSKALALDIDEMTKIGTGDALAQYSTKLTTDDDTWNQDYRVLVYYILGTDPMANTSPVPTLMLPSQAPTAAPSASGSPAASASADATSAASASVAPSPSAS